MWTVLDYTHREMKNLQSKLYWGSGRIHKSAIRKEQLLRPHWEQQSQSIPSKWYHKYNNKICHQYCHYFIIPFSLPRNNNNLLNCELQMFSCSVTILCNTMQTENKCYLKVDRYTHLAITMKQTNIQTKCLFYYHQSNSGLIFYATFRVFEHIALKF